MTVKELKRKLEKYPDNMDVFITQINDAYPLALLESAEIIKANFYEDDDSENEPAKVDVVLLTDEFKEGENNG